MNHLAKHLHPILKKNMRRLDEFDEWSDDARRIFKTFAPARSATHAQKNLELKHHVAQQWSNANPEQKKKLAHDVIKGWGTLKNHERTIEKYIELTNSKKAKTPLAGVSSYSKLLAFALPDSYAIYDSRVAVALNALQLLTPSAAPGFFHYPTGRSSAIVRFSSVFNHATMKAMGWKTGHKNDAYSSYMELLKFMACSRYTIQHYEMLLFALAPGLCEEILPKVDALVLRQWKRR